MANGLLGFLAKTALPTAACCALLAFSACGGPASAPATPEAQAPQGPRVELQVNTVDQMAQLGPKISDGGQYVLIGVTLKNQTLGSVKFDPKDFLIRKKSAPGATAPAYEQGVEPDMTSAFTEQFGKESEMRLINPEASVHAGFEIQKVLIYNLPKNDTLEVWQLRYAPSNVVVDLQGPGVKITDHRVPVDPDAEHEGE